LRQRRFLDRRRRLRRAFAGGFAALGARLAFAER
jgi:hypothetical protein